MIRTVLFWTHLTAGVVTGAIILLMSVTGVMLTYEKQMLRWADTRQLSGINATLSTRLGADSLIVLATAAKRGNAPTSFVMRADPTTPAQVSFGQAGVVYLHPATGAVLGTGSDAARAFFRSVTNWHRWLAGEGPNRDRGRAITGASNLAFLLLVLTGMVLWIPKTITWIRIRSVLWFRTGLSAKAREFNWHHVLGIWSAVPLIAIVVSGSVISYPWASDLVYKAVGEVPPPRTPPGPPAGETVGSRAGDSGRAERRPADAAGAIAAATDSIVPGVSATAAPQFAAMIGSSLALMPDWKSVTLQVPKPDARTASITLDRGTGAQPQYRATVTVNTSTGAITKYQPFDSLTTGRKVRNVLRFAHTGEVLGLTGQTIAGLVSLASVILVYTGIALALRRAARTVSRRRAAVHASRIQTSAVTEPVR